MVPFTYKCVTENLKTETRLKYSNTCQKRPRSSLAICILTGIRIVLHLSFALTFPGRPEI